MAVKKNKLPHATIESLESRQLLSTSQAVTPDLVLTAAAQSGFTGYTPAQIKKAYGFDHINGNGAGQTIAIVDAFDDPDIVADLRAFDAKYGLPDTTITKVSETGGSTKNVKADKGWATEIALDVEWAHAIAPGAKIDLVEANSDYLNDLMAAVDVARRLTGVSVVSMSWGSGEFFGQTYFDKYFTTPKGHNPVTFVAASGDEGSWYGPEFPATSSQVLAVGGTTLNLTSTGAYSSESAWSDSTGGVSNVVLEPSYQAGVQSTGLRSSPDVSYNANPNTGFAIFDSYGSGGWDVVGGTSAGAPQWAALVALADQVRASKGLTTLDGSTATLPTLYKLYNASSTYNADFHDVATGRSSIFYSATAGYDAVTGLGTPQAAAVVAALSNATTTALTTVTLTRTARRRAASARATAAVVQSTAADAIIVLPNRPLTVYTRAPRQAPEILNALVIAPMPNETRVQFASTPIGAASHVSTPAVQDAAFVESATISIPTTTAPQVSLDEAATPNLDAAAAMKELSEMLSDSAPAMSSVAPVVASAMVSQPAAWATTLGVLALDAVLVGRWCMQNAQAKRQAKSPTSPFALERIVDDKE